MIDRKTAQPDFPRRDVAIACLIVACEWLAFLPAASAHDVWLTLSGDASHRRVVINYGHPDDRPPALAEKVVDLFEITSAAKTSLLPNLEPASVEGVFVVQSQPFNDDGHALLAARYDNGYWVKTGDGVYRNATRRLVPDAVESIWSSKFAKAVTGVDAPWRTVMGHDLELMPLSDPATVLPGQNLKLRVLFHGKPLPGAEVERGDGVSVVPEKDIPRFATDADGIATIPVIKTGPTLLVVDHRISPSAVPDVAGSDLYNATFWFTVHP